MALNKPNLLLYPGLLGCLYFYLNPFQSISIHLIIVQKQMQSSEGSSQGRKRPTVEDADSDVEADNESGEQSSEEVAVERPARGREDISSFSSEEDNVEEDGDEEYDTLEDLIGKLNDDDHSEDEGIEDYKVGGYHPCHIGEVLNNRYVLIQKLGWGHFSTVWLAKDFKHSTYVAVKIMKSSPHYLEASYDEVQILQKVAKNAFHPQWIKSLKDYEPDKKKYDRDDTHVLNLLNAFLYKGPYGNHFCMVFEILGTNLWEILKKYDCKGIPINAVKQITRQVLMGLDFLNRICRVIHTDLKPENVLVCLTEEQLRKIVEDEQLSSAGDHVDRLNYYCTKYGLGPAVERPFISQVASKQPSSQDNEQNESESEALAEIKSKLQEVKEKLERAESHNYRKTLRKKLKKLEEQEQTLLALLEARNQEKSVLKEKSKNGMKQQEEQFHKAKASVKQLFVKFKRKISFDTVGGGLTENTKVKIADLGNACWEHHHFATEIQTRQYRGPEVLLGSQYNLSADMWSVACMTFELLTGELLFNPKKDNSSAYGKNDDHLAQIMELMGRLPKKLSFRGQKARKYISKEGALSRIPRLQNWSLKDVMIAKYRFKEDQAEFFQSFMMPLLSCYPERRVLAQQILLHTWLKTPCPQSYLMDYETHQKVRMERYDLTEERDEVHQYESEREDGGSEDNNDNEEDEDLFDVEKVGSIGMIDRSFTDLGYIGYGTGIFLEKLDFGPNWQFD